MQPFFRYLLAVLALFVVSGTVYAAELPGRAEIDRAMKSCGSAFALDTYRGLFKREFRPSTRPGTDAFQLETGFTGGSPGSYCNRFPEGCAPNVRAYDTLLSAFLIDSEGCILRIQQNQSPMGHLFLELSKNSTCSAFPQAKWKNLKLLAIMGTPVVNFVEEETQIYDEYGNPADPVFSMKKLRLLAKFDASYADLRLGNADTGKPTRLSLNTVRFWDCVKQALRLP